MFENIKDRLRKGMSARTADGRQLGKITDIDDDVLVMDGAGGKHDYVAEYDQISDINGEDVIINTRELNEGESEDYERPRGLRARAEARREAREGEAQTLPLMEEKLDVAKRERAAGEVRLRKRVITERKQFTVPVTRETVKVERVAATGNREIPEGEAFREQTISIPVTEEEVEIKKRPVVREEVRLKKERTTTEQRVADTVRREEVELEDAQRPRSNEENTEGYGAPPASFDPSKRR
jgi:uncharacterized protein (TIGR02271 family)